MSEFLVPKGTLRRGDPHLHTSISDSNLPPGKAALESAKAGMNWIALTDHNLTPSQRAYENALDGIKNTKYEGRVAIFKGAELDVKHKGVVGHVAVFFSPGKNCYELERATIALLHREEEPDLVDLAKWTQDQNGVMLITHPNQWGLIGYPLWVVHDAVQRIRDKGIETAIGFEVITATRKVFPPFLRLDSNFTVLNNFARQHGLAPAASSDAHNKRLIDKAFTVTYADRDIKDGEDEFDSIQQAFKNAKTRPSFNKLGKMGLLDVKLLQLDIGFCEFLKVAGRYFIKKNGDWDPFYAGRWLESRLGIMSLEDFELTQRIKEAQEAYRQQVFKEDGIDQHIRTHIRLRRPRQK